MEERNERIRASGAEGGGAAEPVGQGNLAQAAGGVLHRDRLGAGELEEIQLSNLREFLIYTRDHCRYWRGVFADRGVDCGAKDILAELAKVPPMDKRRPGTSRRHDVG